MTLRILDRRGGITLYGRVADAIREKITSGVWPEGTRLPTLDVLASQFGVARVTVRQACQMLASEGLLRSRPGKGTFVERSPKDLTLNAALHSYRDESSPFSISVDSCERVPQAQAPGIIASHGSVADSYTRIRKTHCLSGSPCAWIDLYVASDLYALWPSGAESTSTVAALIRGLPDVRMERGYELVEIGQASESDASRLDYGVGMPVARVTRLYADHADRVIYAGFNVYRGDRFRYEHDIVSSVAYGTELTVHDTHKPSKMPQ